MKDTAGREDLVMGGAEPVRTQTGVKASMGVFTGNPMTRSMTLQRWLLPPATAALAFALQVGAGQAQTAPIPQKSPEAGRRMEQLQKLTDSQKQELFSARRSIGLKSYPAQIAILQKGERCLSGARDLQELSACRQEESNTRRELMERNREELRTAYQRLGLSMPGGRWGARNKSL